MLRNQSSLDQQLWKINKSCLQGVVGGFRAYWWWKKLQPSFDDYWGELFKLSICN